MRSLVDVARSSLTTLATFWVALFAVAGGVDLLLDSSVDKVDLRVPMMAVWFGASAAAIATGLLPEARRVPALLTVTASLALVTVLAREGSGLVAPWIEITLAAGMLTTAVGLTLPYQVVPWASLLVVAVVLVPQRWDEMAREDSPVQLGVPLVEAALVICLGLLGALIRAVLTQSAARADAGLTAAEAGRRTAVAERSAEDALTAHTTLLHDTALNTLNAVALGAAGDEAALRSRCRDDARRLSAIDPSTTASSLTDAVEASAARARLLGLRVGVHHADNPAEPTIPASVVAAVAGATDEALLNCAKHARSDRADLCVETRPGSLTVTISDDGVGFAPASRQPGLGIEHSITARLTAVGGDADVDSRPGSGTRVVLRWSAEPAADAVTTTMSGSVLRLLVSFLAVTTVFTSTVVLAEWAAFERAGVALVGGLLLGGWGLAVTWLLQRRRWIPTTVGALTVALACLAPFWTISSDQYCSSSLGGVGWVDPRLALVVLVILTTGRWPRAIAAVPAVVAAALVAGMLWDQAYPGCSGWSVSAALYAVAVLSASLIAVRTLNRQTTQLAGALRDRDEAQQARARAAAMRAEHRQWLAPALDSCVPLLTSLGHGRIDPSSQEARDRCRAESGYLRSLLTVAAAPPGARDALRDLVLTAHGRGLDVVVRGSVDDLPDAPPELSTVLTALVPEVPEPRHQLGGHQLLVTVLPIDGLGTVIISASDSGPAPCPTVCDDAPGIDLTVDADNGWWAQVSWPPGASSRPVAPEGAPAASR
jgi:signal transduction histidine kinase